ncbi:ATP-binding protein [Parabacteroides sp.]
MEDIPNKVRDMLGILVDVNLKEKDEKQYLEIVTEAYPYPISFRGKYYQRSGATNQELKGVALDRFMLRKQGKTWDGVPVPYLKAEDLDNVTFDLFRKYAKRSGRMEDADLMDDNHGLLEKLRLYEGCYLKRAAAHRIETLPMPREALREALLNACINKDYAEPSPIQIRVYENKLEIVNGGVLPDGWTVETLLSSHRSFPYNPDIANTFFRSGEIEAWGRGIERIIMACKNDGFSTPEFRYDASGIWTIFKFEYPERATTQKTTQKTIQNLMGQQQAILSFLKEHPEATRKEISEDLLNITEDGVKYNLSRLQELGLLRRVGGRKQGYWQIIG